jgi:phosphate transport system permease protein
MSNPTEASIDELVKKEQKKADSHYIKTKRINFIATSVLWAAAVLTLAVLLYILGFILYKGVRSDNIIESDFINRGTLVTPQRWYKADSVLIVNNDLRLKEINNGDIEALFSGKPTNWGNINEQDLQVYPYLLSYAKGESGKNTIFKNSVKEIASAVESQQGALGLIPAENIGQIQDYKVRLIPVQALVIGVNPSVFEIKNNVKLRYIDGKMLKQILNGSVSNWKQVGGIDQRLQLIAPPIGSYEYEAWLELAGIEGGALPENAIPTESETEYSSSIKNTPGAIGIILEQTAASEKVDLLKFQFRQTGKNLQFWFLFEEPKRAGRVGGISSIIINTVYMVLLTVLFSTPLGIGAAVYLTEYAKQGRFVKIIRLGTETLAGIPSIIFGLFGFIVFVGAMHLGIGLLSGTLTLTLMILPTIVRTSEEAIKGVPKSFRAGSLALGAGKWQTIYKVVIPAAAPGILTGVILAIGRAVGETAALLFTMGFDYRRVENLSTSARVLSTHLYQLVKEGISFDRAFATATILILIVLIVNIVSTKLIVRKY